MQSATTHLQWLFSHPHVISLLQNLSDETMASRHLSFRRINSRIILAMSGVVASVVIVVILLATFQINQLIRGAEERELESIFREMNGELKNNEKFATSLANAVALQPSTRQLFAQRDRAALLREYLPVYKKMQKDYAVRQFQFHTAPARSFLRLHKPEKFSDDLSSFRHTVVLANTSGQPVTGLEVGVAGLGIRGVVPMFYQGKQTGTVEFGLSFGKPFLEEFKKRYSVRDVELAFYLATKDYLHKNGTDNTVSEKTEEFKTFASTYEGSPLLTGEELLLLVNESSGNEKETENPSANEIANNVETIRNNRAVFGAPIHDFSGKAIGVIEISMDRSFYLRQLNSFRLFLLITGILAAIAGVIISLYTGRSISHPIYAVITRIRDIAEGEGDLTQRLNENSDDEMGELATWINRFIEKIYAIVKEITFDTSMILSSAKELTGASVQLTERMAGIAERAESISSTATQMDQSFHMISNSMEEMRLSLDEVSQQSMHASEIAHIGDTTSDKTNQIMADLEKKAKEIDNVSESIKSITGQTNLLALNASIEAAGAGEAGKGFAVVANEVKELAGKTSQSSEEIREEVSGIQKSARKALFAISEITGIVKEIDQINNKIAGSMAQYTDRVHEVTDSIQQASMAAKDAARNIEEITGATQECKASAGQLEQLAVQLNSLSDNLNRIVNRFKI